MFRVANLKIKSFPPSLCVDDKDRIHLDSCNDTKHAMRKLASKEVCSLDNRFIYAVVSGLHGDAPNENGDYFEWDSELLKRKPNGIYTYATWIQRPNLINHNEEDVVGMILDTQPILGEKSVDMLLRVDRGRRRIAGKDLADLVESGKVTGVSMGCNVAWSRCSHCNNIAYTEKDWCKDLRWYKGQKHPDTGQIVYEDNKDITGLEVSWICTGQPADPKAQRRYLLD